MVKNRGLQAEGGLLLCTLLVLACAAMLVFLGRTRDGSPSNAINLNTLAPEQFGPTFNLDPALANELVKYRDSRHGFDYVQQFTSVNVFPTMRERKEVAQRLHDNNIDPNIETADSLTTRLSISVAAARRIIQFRNRLTGSKFSKPDQMMRVPMIENAQLRLLGNRLIVRYPLQVFIQFGFWIIATFFTAFGVAIYSGKKSSKGDPVLLSLSLILTVLGAVTLFSVKDALRDTLVSLHHLQGACLGLVVYTAAALIPAHVRRGWKRLTYVFALTAIFTLAILKVLGTGPEGVNLSVFGIQPVEIIKVLLVLFIAGYLADRGDLLADTLSRWNPPVLKGRLKKIRFALPRWQDSGPIIGMFVAAMMLFFVIKDMGPALVLFSTFILTMYAVTGRTGVAILGFLMMVVGETAAFLLKLGVMPVRIDMWLAPWHNSHKFGMQLGQSMWGMASGGLMGSGLGLGSPSEMPRSGSDLIYSSIGEDLGAFGSIFVMLVFLLIAYRGLKIARQAQNDFDRVLAIGISCLLTSQVFFIAAGVTGMLPLTGISMPFLAYGNSSLVVSFFLTGLLRGISSKAGQKELLPERPLFVKTTRNLAFTFGFCLLALIGVGRSLWIQGVRADSIAGASITTPDADEVVRPKTNPRLTKIEHSIPRGTIYDRNGTPLATSRFDEMSNSMNNDQEKARIAFQKGRLYTRGSDFAHILGILDPQVGSLGGVERDFQHELRGFRQYSELVSDYRWKDMPAILQKMFTGQSERKGADVHLTLDANMQRLAFQSLKSKLKKGDDKQAIVGQGALVVLDPVSGDLLAAVSWPTFDPNKINHIEFSAMLADEDKLHRGIDRSSVSIYPPGSTFKVPLAALALDNQIDPEYNCDHVMKNATWVWGGEVYARKSIADDKNDPPHGTIRMANAMKVSCNLYFANIALKLGADRFYHGLTNKELWGFSHIRPLKEFAAGLPTDGFGQGGVLVTPLEMARVAGAIGGGGVLMKSRIVTEVRTRDGKQLKANLPSTLSKPLSPETADQLRKMMESVVSDGTARGLFDRLNFRIAGKTGTAQTDSGDKQPHSWFIGFAPSVKPKYAFACIIENGGYGKQGAAPVVRRFLEALESH